MNELKIEHVNIDQIKPYKNNAKIHKPEQVSQIASSIHQFGFVNPILIDENDEIYNDLKVWIRNEDGTDSLLSLKKADVGAIYLGSTVTDFSLRDSSFNTAAKLRASGVFLKESGGVGVVQQIDLATHEEAIENRSIS